MSALSSSVSVRDSDHFVSVDIDLLECDLVPSLDVSEEIALSAGYEHDGFPFRTCPTGTTDSVDVGFRIFRYVIIDHEFDILHIESACGNVGRDEDIADSVLESLEGAGTVTLVHVPMKASGTVSVAIEHIGDILRFVLHTAEYYDLGILVVLYVFFEHVVLLEVRYLDEGMVDLGDCELLCGLDGFVAVSDVFRKEVVDFLWNGRGESHGLLDGSEPGPDHIDIVDESHIEHAVHLVEDEVFHMGKVYESPFYEVDETPWGRDHDLRTSFERLPLCPDIGTSVDRKRAEEHPVGEFEEFFPDLHGKLAGRSEDDDLRLADAGIDLLEKGYDECGSLTGTGLGLSDDIFPFHGRLDDFFLDLRGFGVAVFRKGLKHFRVKTEF